MARKEIQPEDIWNDEKLNMVKEHILNHIKNQTPANIAETELVAKKYAEEDMVDKKYTEEDVIDSRDELSLKLEQFGNFIRDNYYGVGAPKLLSYNTSKYPHANIKQITDKWIEENF